MKVSKFITLGFLISATATLSACGGGEHMPINANAKTKATAVVLFSDIKPIFEKVCTSCHMPGGSLPNWLDYSVIMAKKDVLYQRVIVKRDMPLGGGLTEAERNLIGRWLENGAPAENSKTETPTLEPTPSPAPEATPTPEPTPVPTPEGPIRPEQGILTYSKDIRPILEKNCALCHNENSGLPNWSDYKVAFERRDRILDRVIIKKDMPLGIPMSDEDRDRIKSWLESGALEE